MHFPPPFDCEVSATKVTHAEKTLSKPFFLKKHGKHFPFFEISFVRLYGLTV